MKSLYSWFLIAFFLPVLTHAQIIQNNVGIGTLNPNPKAILELKSDGKGFLVPRTDSIGRTQIYPNQSVNPDGQGMLVYDTLDQNFWYYDGNDWVKGIGPAGPIGPTGPAGLSNLDSLIIQYASFDSVFASYASFDSLFSSYLNVDSLFIGGSNITNLIDSMITSAGTVGPTGATGKDGAQGAQGPAGADGQDGATGPTGATGAQGPAGTNGINGQNGKDGATGATGKDGAAGAQGPSGVDGKDGATGATGADGKDGKDGATGAQGPTGADGSSNGWSLTGNAATTPGTNFIGTTDSKDFVIKTNNSERMRVTSGGNVGIGTSNPSYPLVVSNSTNARSLYVKSTHPTAGQLYGIFNDVYSSGTSGLRVGIYNDVEASNGTYNTILSYNRSSLGGTNAVKGIYNFFPEAAGSNNSITSNDTYIDVDNAHTNNLIGYNATIKSEGSGTHYGVKLAFDNAGTGIHYGVHADMGGYSNGWAGYFIGKGYFSDNVGIGTSSATQLLHVNGNMRLAGALYDMNNSAGAADEVLVSNGSGVYWANIADIGGASSASQWGLSGNAGTTAGTNFLGTTDSQDLVFKTGNTERLRIKSDGFVGIGGSKYTGQLISGATQTLTIAASNSYYAGLESSLELVGSSISTNPGSNGIGKIDFVSMWGTGSGALINNIARIEVIRGSSPADGSIVLSTNDGTTLSERVRISDSGNVGIGTTNPNSKLQVSGDVTADNYNYTSPKTRYYSVDNTAFVQVNGNSAELDYLTSNGTYLYMGSGVSYSGYVVAPINIPDGATITEVKMYGYDSDASNNLTMELQKRLLTSYSVTTIASSATTGSSGTQQILASASELVDNSTYAYRVHVKFDAQNAGVALRVYTVRITYTVSHTD